MRRQRSPKFVFLRAYCAQLNRTSPPKLTYKRHILGMSTSPRNISKRVKLCRLSWQAFSSKLPILLVSGPGKSPAQKFGSFSTSVHVRQPIHVFSVKSGRNRCMISGRKAALTEKNKTRFDTFSCVSAHHCRTLGLYFRFHPDVWGSYNRKTPQWPQNKYNIGSSCAITTNADSQSRYYSYTFVFYWSQNFPNIIRSLCLVSYGVGSLIKLAMSCSDVAPWQSFASHDLTYEWGFHKVTVFPPNMWITVHYVGNSKSQIPLR